MKLSIHFKGGPGSGHHGHEGRPGLVGGSQADEGGISYNGLTVGDGMTTARAVLMPDGKFLTGSVSGKTNFHTQIMARLALSNPGDYDPDVIKEAQELVASNKEEDKEFEAKVMEKTGAISVTVGSGFTTIKAMTSVESPTVSDFNKIFKQIKKFILDGRIPRTKPASYNKNREPYVTMYVGERFATFPFDETDLVQGFREWSDYQFVPYMKESK